MTVIQDKINIITAITLVKKEKGKTWKVQIVNFDQNRNCGDIIA